MDEDIVDDTSSIADEAAELLAEYIENKTSVETCSRCQGHHLELYWKELSTPLHLSRGVVIIGYAQCPVNFEPIVLYYTE